MSKSLRSQLTDKLYEYRKRNIDRRVRNTKRPDPHSVLFRQRPEMEMLFQYPVGSLDYLAAFVQDHDPLFNKAELECMALMACRIMNLLYEVKVKARSKRA